MRRQDHTPRPPGHTAADRTARPAGSAGWLAGALSLLGLGCGSDPKPTPPPPSFASRLESAWESFEGSRYRAARAEFRELTEEATASSSVEPAETSDAWLGRAWCGARLDSLSLARSEVTEALTASPTEDAWVLAALIAGAEGRDSLVVVALDAGYRAPYLFRHDPDISDRTVRLLLATALFHARSYERCYDVVRLLDPSIKIDLSSPFFREALADELARLSG